LTTRRDALGHTTQYRYDAAGRLIEVVEPGVDKGSANDGTSVIQHAIHQYTWNGEGQLLAYTDPLGGSTRYTYDGDGRPLTRTDAAGRSLVYRYDPAGRLTTLVNENSAQTPFLYNLLDQLTDEIGFDGRHQRYCYNAAGELTHLIETGGTDVGPGKVTHFERDALGHLLAKRSSSQKPISGDTSCHLRGGTRGDHFKNANEQLHKQLKNDPDLAKPLGPDVVAHVKPGPRGGYKTTSQPGLTWHHSAQDPSQLELIPRGQHKTPGPVQETLHPDQQGGFKKFNC
jgi:YD repeat-containing protein